MDTFIILIYLFRNIPQYLGVRNSFIKYLPSLPRCYLFVYFAVILRVGHILAIFKLRLVHFELHYYLL